MELHELVVARSCEMARGDRAQLLNVGEVRMQLKQRWHGRAAWHGVTVLQFWPVEKCMARFGVFVGEMCLGVWKSVGQQT